MIPKKRAFCLPFFRFFVLYLFVQVPTMDKKEVSKRVAAGGTGTFLVRPSSQKEQVVLVCNDNGKAVSYPIKYVVVSCLSVVHGMLMPMLMPIPTLVVAMVCISGCLW